MKIYDLYPEITSLRAKVINKQFKNNITSLQLDKYIIMPDNEFLLNDYIKIDDNDILNVKENKGKIIINVKGRIKSNEVLQKLDKSLRYRNLYYNTAYILFKIFIENYYGNYKTNLFLSNDKAYISIIDFNEEFDNYLFEEMLNYAILSNLPIKTESGITKIKGLGSVINSYINFDNAYKIRSFKILNTSKNNNNTIMSFFAGK